ncbi:MAG: hypothetical protein K8R18_11115 [Parvibaculum sp.]|uniref:hypothetical protein n=1 Tax=Parvibaculum sp. TaxID=2024848 RepID=UPI0025ED65DA|nr:hypothetical protein [Parvibaculum sp.]MCE9650161.1 hypothetical protein [Parvibaculum sp.]
MEDAAIPAVDISSEVAEPAAALWLAVTTPRGVNAELMPFIRMTFPEADMRLADAPLDTPLFGSWIFLFGVLPFDRHTFVIHEVGARHFVETSRSLLQKLWRHERSLTETAGGTIIRDVVTVIPRFSFAAPATNFVVRAIFRHRHRRLARLYGAAQEKPAGPHRRAF